MENLPKFRFDGYELTPATEEDLPLATRWVQTDMFHRNLDPEFWTRQLPGINCYLLRDSEGPVFFFRMQLTAVTHELCTYIQFGPRNEVSRERTTKGMTDGMRWLEDMARSCGFNRLVFSSKNISLVLFARRTLGFDSKKEGDQILLYKAI